MYSLLALCNGDPYRIIPKHILQLQEPHFTPFHLTACIIFFLAVIHIFFVNKITAFAETRKGNLFLQESLHFLGEVEVIFALWGIPLIISVFFFYNWQTAVDYIMTRNFTEPMFIVVIMTLTATYPIVKLAEDCLNFFAKMMGGSIAVWWFFLLTLAPLLGSFITEPGAMTLIATLLIRQFYQFHPSSGLAYATIGLLFTNVSVGGMLTSFAAPPILIISRCWERDTLYMFLHYGWKVVLGIFISTILYLVFFRKEFQKMEEKKQLPLPNTLKKSIPFWITAVHILFIVWTLFNAAYPAMFIAGFLLYLGFQIATAPFQQDTGIKKPLLVGLFLAGLILHGGLQGWWIRPLLSDLSPFSLMTLCAFLTSFNDNAAIVYLASHIPNLSETLKDAVLSGAMVAGGLTVIANAPNPAGYVLLKNYFPKGISPLFLLLGALLPTIIFFTLFSI